jgi:hypothetical protein
MDTFRDLGYGLRPGRETVGDKVIVRPVFYSPSSSPKRGKVSNLHSHSAKEILAGILANKPSCEGCVGYLDCGKRGVVCDAWEYEPGALG